jgi:hypothetical protein
MERCAPTPGARLSTRSRVGEEFRAFAHGVCKDDADLLHVIHSNRGVVYQAAWEAAVRQLGQRTNAHTTRKFWTDGPAASVSAFHTHDTRVRVETGDDMGFWSKEFASMPEELGRVKNIGPHPQITMTQSMVKTPTYGLQQRWRAS